MKRVYRNTALNIGSQVIVMLVMFLAMPWIVRGLGDTSFAILSLVWTVVGYFTLWDWGIGRAVTKFVAERRAVGRERDVREIVFVSVVVSTLLGMVIGYLIVGFSRPIGSLLFTVSQSYFSTVDASLKLVGLFMPLLLLQGVFRGVLMGLDRFDLSNLVQVLNSALQWGGAMVLVVLHFGVVWIICFIMLGRLVTTIVLVILTQSSVNWIGIKGRLDLSLVKGVLLFGGWVMVSQVVSPLLQYAERFFLSGMVATSMVTYYIVPYEATSKMLVLSVGLVSALYPAMSELHGTTGLGDDFKKLYLQSERVLIFAFLPIGAGLCVFAPEVLRLWMGAVFTEHATSTFELLSIAFVASSIAQLPYTILQAVGRSDLTGRVHLIELPIHFIVTFLLVKSFGLMGAAVATLFRLILDAFLLYMYASTKLGLKVGFLTRPWKKFLLPAMILVVAAGSAIALQHDLVAKAGVALLGGILYFIIVFRYALEENEKRMIRAMLPGRAGA